MTQVVLPKLSQSGKNEFADVEDNDVALREVVNGELDNENLKAGAGIVGSKLAEGTIEEKKLSAALKTLTVTEPVRSTVEQLKVIRGIVNTTGAGSIVEGSGFTVTGGPFGVGDIEIHFTANFSDVPTVVATAYATSVKFVQLTSVPTVAAVLLGRFTSAGVGEDGIIHFMAIGPR